MSSTTIEINASALSRPDVMLEAMPRPYVPAASWVPDPHSRSHPHSHSHSHHTQAQLRHDYDQQRPRPAASENSGLDSRRPSQFHSPQHQRPSDAFQSAALTPSNPHLSHASAPLGLPSHQQYMPASQGHGYSRLSSFSSVGEAPDTFEGQQMQMPLSRKSSIAGIQSQPSTFSFGQRAQATDMRSAPRAYEARQSDAVTGAGVGPPHSPAVSPTELKHDPMKISDILSPGASNHAQQLPAENDETEYRLTIRQQPIAARSCGFGERDRRVVDPPPIVQLIIEGPDLSQDEISRQLRYCHYVMSCSIYDETGTRDASFMPEEYRQQRRLMGSLVGAPFVGKDEFGQEGCFFCFPDLSCRTPGSYRLKFNLVKIDPARAKEVKHFPVLVEAKSEVFTVYTAKDFPGMQASTRLTKRLKEQGCIISIKKGNDRAKNPRAHDESSEGEQEDGDMASQGKRRRRMGGQ